MRRMSANVLRPHCTAVVLALGLIVALPARPAAHEVPANVLVQAFVKPEGNRLWLLVRVPLSSMRDINFPLRDPGYLIVDQVEPLLRDGARLWIADFVELYENGARLDPPRIVAARVSLPGDRSFTEYEGALAHVMGPPPRADTELFWDQWLMDVVLEYTIESEDSDFAMNPALAHLGLRTTTGLRFLPPDGPERAYQYAGDPGLVQLDPRWYHAAYRFIVLGFVHILDGIDHLLFVLLLVIPFRRLRPLIAIVTSFTVAHSITLAASASGLAPDALWFPPLVETLIALSIVYMALENIVGGVGMQRRWLLAFGFGLVHGFGFSFLLRESLQFAGSHLITSLFAFNLGVELGQILVVLLLIPVLYTLFRYVVAERIGTIILSAFVAHTAWHWVGELGTELRGYAFQWPAFDLALLAATMRWLMLLLILVGVVWFLHQAYQRLMPARAGRRVAELER